MVLATSPFAPDTASGWVAVAINLVISSATVCALILTVRTNRRSMDREHERDQRERQDALERRASRQAASVRLAVKRHRLQAGKGHATYTPSIVNESNNTVFSATVEWVRAVSAGQWQPRSDVTGLMTRQYIGRVPGGFTEDGGLIWENDSAADDEDDLPLRLTFVDAYGDKWQLDPDRTLTLLAAATIRRS